MTEKWIDWAKELQFLAQCGLAYSKDKFDIERFERIREISAEILSHQTEIPFDKVNDLFCNETGFQTPKLDTRAAIFEEDKILLVQEENQLWSLPGGWCDVQESVKSNIEKEVLEESGLHVQAQKIIAVQDRNKHNRPPYAFNICKVFLLCKSYGGAFQENMETIDSNYFSLSELPHLDSAKNTEEQISLCFDAYQDPAWETAFD